MEPTIAGHTVHILRLDADVPTEQVIAIVDEAKRQVECMLVGLPAADAAMTDAGYDDTPRCVWCYDAIASSSSPDRIAVGCPVAFVSAQHIRTQVQKGRENFTIRENVAEPCAPTPAQGHILAQQRPAHYKVKHQFCTLNCVLAFAQTKNTRSTHDAIFANSVVLVHKLYRSLAGVAAPELVPAPDWALLCCFGGPLTRAVFRQRLGNAVYRSYGTAMVPLFRAYGQLVEEKVLLRVN